MHRRFRLGINQGYRRFIFSLHLPKAYKSTKTRYQNKNVGPMGKLVGTMEPQFDLLPTSVVNFVLRSLWGQSESPVWQILELGIFYFPRLGQKSKNKRNMSRPRTMCIWLCLCSRQIYSVAADPTHEPLVLFMALPKVAEWP